MSFWSSFGDTIWWFLTFFVFIAYLMALFTIVGDLFRDTKLGGFAKAVWLIFLIFVPFLTALVYLIARGGGMAERAAEQQRRAQSVADDYIRSVAGATPGAQIAQANDLLRGGIITQAEFDQLKAKALG